MSNEFPLAFQSHSHDLNKTNAQILLFTPKVGKTVQTDDIYEVFPKQIGWDPIEVPPIFDERVPSLTFITHTAKRHLNGMIQHRDVLAYDYPTELLRNAALKANEVAVLVFASENGEQVVALSQSNLINTANSVGHAIGLDQSNATLNGLAVASASGLAAGLMLPLVRRSKMVVSSDVASEDIPRLHDAIAQHGVDTVVGDAVLFEAILKQSKEKQIKAFAEAIKKVLLVGDHSPVSSALIKDIQSTLGVAQVHVSNGSANSTGVALVNGKPLANSQVKLVDASGKDTTSQGFLAVNGINTFQGYYTPSAVDASSIKGGFVTTNIKAKQDSPNSFTVIN